MKSQWNKIFGGDKSISGKEFYDAAKRATGENRKAMNAMLEHTSEGRTIFGLAAGWDLQLTPNDLATFINHTTHDIARGRFGYAVKRETNNDLWQIAYAKELLLYDEYMGSKATRFGKNKRITTGALSLATYLMDIQVHTSPSIKDEAQIMRLVREFAKMPTVGPGVVDVAKWVGMHLNGNNYSSSSDDQAPQANDEAPQSADITPQAARLLSQAQLMMRLPALGELGGGVERRLLALHERRFTRGQLDAHLPGILLQVQRAHDAIATEIAAALVHNPGVFRRSALGRGAMEGIQDRLSRILYFTVGLSARELVTARLEFTRYVGEMVPDLDVARIDLVLRAVIGTVYLDTNPLLPYTDQATRDRILDRFYQNVTPAVVTVGLPAGDIMVGYPDPDLSLFRANLHDEL